MAKWAHKRPHPTTDHLDNQNCQTPPRCPPTTMSPASTWTPYHAPFTDPDLLRQNLTYALRQGLDTDPRWHQALRRYLNTAPQPTNRKDTHP